MGDNHQFQGDEVCLVQNGVTEGNTFRRLEVALPYLEEGHGIIKCLKIRRCGGGGGLVGVMEGELDI